MLILIVTIYLGTALITKYLVQLYNKKAKRPIHRVLRIRSKKIIWILWPWTLVKAVVYLSVCLVCLIGYFILKPIVPLFRLIFNDDIWN